MYYILYGFLYVLSLLPLKVLYTLGDLLYLLIYKLAGYRKKVVMHNLSIAFPEKSIGEREKIAASFYHNFIDTFIETIKLLSASDEWISRHCEVDTTILKELHQSGKKCQVHLGHNFNWEIGNLAVQLDNPYLFLGVYMPLTNKTFDRLFKKIRSRYGTILLPATRIKSALIPYRNEQYMMGLVADQNPGVPSRAYWFEFFGRKTPFVTGPEKNARNNQAAVIFAWLSKKKRGYYKIHFQLATASPETLPEKELTRTYVSFLETMIRNNPDMWLWSHRRWKHEWKEEYATLS